jgi:peptidyl-prolyl cis-trans isomerase A (cyclophilin A)
VLFRSAHGYKGDAQYGWVADLLDNKITVGKFFSIQEGLNYNTDTDSITQGMAIAALVTATDILAAKAKISVTDPIDLTIAIPSTSVNILMTTSMGNILIALDPARAPITTANFLKYTNAGFYTNKIFHRVIPGFMIQGGGFTADLVQAATYAPIKLEVGNGLSNLRGTIAMARTNVLDSATSQFFINVVDNTFLDTSGGGYAVFGKVLSGMDVADKIVAVQTKTVGGFQNVPVAPITIISVAQVN